MNKVLVTGGTGFIGSHLVEALVEKGASVRCLVRTPDKLRWLENVDVEIVQGDLTDFDSLIPVVSDVQTIFHLAGKTSSLTEEDLYLTNAQGTMNLLKANVQGNPNLSRFVYISSLAAAGPSLNGRPVCESDHPNPLSPYGASKLAGEEAVMAFHPQMPVTIIRPPVVFGPRDIAILNFFKTIKNGIKPVLGWRTRYGSFIYVEDLVRGILLAAEKKNAEGQTYYLVSDNLIAYQELNNAIARALGKKGLTMHVPISWFAIVVAIREMVYGMKKKATIMNRHKVHEVRERFWVCDGSKARKELGFTPEFSLEEGLDKTADWYSEMNWL